MTQFPDLPHMKHILEPLDMHDRYQTCVSSNWKADEEGIRSYNNTNLCSKVALPSARIFMSPSTAVFRQQNTHFTADPALYRTDSPAEVRR